MFDGHVITYTYPSFSRRSLAVISPLPGVTSPIPIENPRLPEICHNYLLQVCNYLKFIYF